MTNTQSTICNAIRQITLSKEAQKCHPTHVLDVELYNAFGECKSVNSAINELVWDNRIKCGQTLNHIYYAIAPSKQPYTLRPYQQEASDKAVAFFRSSREQGALMVLPTGSGKSLVIADIAQRLDTNVLVLQSSKEILVQNFNKLCAYGMLDCSVYSASCNSKRISKVTFATIGSIVNRKQHFSHFKHIIIDECHSVNPRDGMYKEFLGSIANSRVLGLTATPYRLHTNSYGSELRFLTRTRTKVFKSLLYNVQVAELAKDGFLSPLEYFSLNVINTNNLRLNTNGADYLDKSIREEYQNSKFDSVLLGVVQRLLYTAQIPRRGVLVFTRFIEEAEALIMALPNGVGAIVTGQTPAKEREQILQDFKDGRLRIVANVGVLTTGFDYPELDTVVLARPTMSLALYYQMVGRAIRPHDDKKSGYIVDLCGNIKRFGRVEELKISDTGQGKWIVRNQTKQLTNVILQK